MNVWGVLAGLGAVALAAVIINEAMRQSQFRDEHGWAFDEIAGSAMSRFDRNGDGVVTTPAWSGWGLLDERIRIDREHVDATQSSTGHDEVDVWSIAPLVARADELGDHDGRATQAEIARVVATFDADRDGRVSRVERQAFVGTYGPMRVWHERTEIKRLPSPAPVPVPTPTPPAKHPSPAPPAG